MKTLPPISIDGKTRLVVKSEAVTPETIDDPGVQACLSYWTEKKGDAFAPKWSEFRLYELPARVLPYLLVLDVAPGPPPTFTYRYWGTGHTQYHRRDYTGKTLEDMVDAWSTELLTVQYLMVMETRRPIVFLNSYDGVETPLKSLRMPLSEDGQTITHMFGYVGRTGLAESLQPLFSGTPG